jgi:hypothetical protein
MKEMSCTSIDSLFFFGPVLSAHFPFFLFDFFFTPRRINSLVMLGNYGDKLPNRLEIVKKRRRRTNRLVPFLYSRNWISLFESIAADFKLNSSRRDGEMDRNRSMRILVNSYNNSSISCRIKIHSHQI